MQLVRKCVNGEVMYKMVRQCVSVWQYAGVSQCRKGEARCRCEV